MDVKQQLKGTPLDLIDTVKLIQNQRFMDGWVDGRTHGICSTAQPTILLQNKTLMKENYGKKKPEGSDFSRHRKPVSQDVSHFCMWGEKGVEECRRYFEVVH